MRGRDSSGGARGTLLQQLIFGDLQLVEDGRFVAAGNAEAAHHPGQDSVVEAEDAAVHAGCTQLRPHGHEEIDGLGVLPPQREVGRRLGRQRGLDVGRVGAE
jgi:hypothetical protein